MTTSLSLNLNLKNLPLILLFLHVFSVRRCLSEATSEAPKDTSEAPVVALRLFSAVRSPSPEQLRQEVMAAELALALSAEVDGLPVVYDSPSVSLALRKVSPGRLTKDGTTLEAPDGSGITIPGDPRVKGRDPLSSVTISLTSYHAGDHINKEMPKIKFKENVHTEMNTTSDNVTNTSNTSTTRSTDRVDFFMTKTSVTWHGTVNVKVPGLSANVPAKDRPWTPLEDDRYAEDKALVKAELERLMSLPTAEKLRGYRKLARQWHPDKHPAEEREKVTEIFEYLQELRLALGLSRGVWVDSQNAHWLVEGNQALPCDDSLVAVAAWCLQVFRVAALAAQLLEPNKAQALFGVQAPWKEVATYPSEDKYIVERRGNNSI
eukprot:Skav202830  [mRNA]  locus=scaffold746:8413:9848:+ [translate_table: standard]